MVIAEIEVGTPATRGQAEQSIFSFAANPRKASPTVSTPGGPPSGPAKLARAPRCAIATAAFAPFPPLMVSKAVACVFTSGRGKCGTRNTMSSTAMPVHSTCFCSAEDIVRLDPGADDVVRDRDRRRYRDLLRMLAAEHLHHLVTREPARVLELLAIDRDLGRGRLRVAADHQRHRERPGLRREVLHAPADDAGFLQRLAPRRFFDALARLDEACEARPHIGDEASGTAHQAAVAVDRQHDHDR